MPILSQAELGFAIDEETLYIGTGNQNIPLAPKAHTHTAAELSGTIAPSAHKASHKTGGSDALTASDIGAAVTVNKTATLSTAWTGSSAPYTQTVSVAGILSSDNPVVDVVLSSDAAASALILQAWAKVSRITTANGSITAYCYDTKPSVAIPIQMKAVR